MTRMGNSLLPFTKFLMRVRKFTKACDLKLHIQDALVQMQDLKY